MKRPDKEIEPRIYPCADCGVVRTASEGGTVFTVCEKCWTAHYEKLRIEELIDESPLTRCRSWPMIKELCFWCRNPFPCGTPHPEGRDELARVLMDLEATTQCPDVDNNLQRAKILGTLLQAERAAMVKLGSEYIRGHWGDSDMVADAMLKELTVPADASALSAVVQRETAKAVEDTHALWCQVLGVPKSEGMPEDIGTIARRAIDAAVTAAMSDNHEKHAAYWPNCRQCQIDAKRAEIE